MSQRDTLDQVLTALHDAMLDDAYWPSASSLIDDACRATGNWLSLAKGPSQANVEVSFARLSYRGQRHVDLEREYFDVYYPKDERFPRILHVPDGQLVHVDELYTDQERKTSPTYNEILPRASMRNSLVVRIDRPDRSRIVWVLCDPVEGGDWSSDRIKVIEDLLPYICRYVCVRQALVDAGALGTSVTALLENNYSGVIQLDRRGRIVAMSDPARDLLRQGDGLSDQGGFLRARSPADDAALQRVLALALPRFGGQGGGASTMVKRTSVLPQLVLHVCPLGDKQMDVRPQRVAALVLIVDSGKQTCVDPAIVSGALGLTPAESQVVVQLAEGKSIGDIAVATGRRESTIRWHVKHIFNKHGISRQAELVRLVLPLAAVPRPRR